MSTLFEDLSAACQYYAELGIDTIPLKSGTKQASLKAWQSRSPFEMWRNAPEYANLGIRCGGPSQVAVIDCDKNETFSNAMDFMQGLGYENGSYPVIQTASGFGRHIYISLSDPPIGAYKTLSRDFGSGEFRFSSGAYVVAPPSSVKNGKYRILEGDFRSLPVINQTDISPIINNYCTLNYLRLPKIPTISRLAWSLLKGNNQNRYRSRSEAEQALLTSLINTGFEFENILELFISYPGPGKFKEKYIHNPEEGIRYLKHSYKKAKGYAISNISRGRQIAINAQQWALSRPWKGRTGAYDRAVYLAHTKIAYRCGKVAYAAPSRDLGELTNISHMAATNATKRLMKVGLIKLEEQAVANLANMYSLHGDFINSQSFNLQIKDHQYSHDVFSYFGLGKSSELIWEQLQQGPKTFAELVERTGKSKPTVKKWLEKMSGIVDYKTGEWISMVYLQGEMWLANPDVNLDSIAVILGVAGTNEQRKRVHRLQREIHNSALSRGRLINGDSKGL
jgi:hypothetical protein